MLSDTSDLLDEIFGRLRARLDDLRDRLDEVRGIELPEIDLPDRPDLPQIDLPDLPDLSGLFSSSDWLLG